MESLIKFEEALLLSGKSKYLRVKIHEASFDASTSCGISNIEYNDVVIENINTQSTPLLWAATVAMKIKGAV